MAWTNYEEAHCRYISSILSWNHTRTLIRIQPSRHVFKKINTDWTKFVDGKTRNICSVMSLYRTSRPKDHSCEVLRLEISHLKLKGNFTPFYADWLLGCCVFQSIYKYSWKIWFWGTEGPYLRNYLGIWQALSINWCPPPFLFIPHSRHQPLTIAWASFVEVLPINMFTESYYNRTWEFSGESFKNMGNPFLSDATQTKVLQWI